MLDSRFALHRRLKSLARSDADLVELARQGDTEAFGELYDRYARLVRAICADRTRDLSAAQDLAQDVFPLAFERLSELRDVARFGAWVVGIARFSSMEWCRQQKRSRHQFPENISEEVDHSGDGTDDRLAGLLSLLGDLPERERLALHAFYLDEHSAEQAAVSLGLSRSGFYKLLDSARRRLALRYRQTQREIRDDP
jgi:RNA polymerase sigma-70 factor, ECF subfamily